MILWLALLTWFVIACGAIVIFGMVAAFEEGRYQAVRSYSLAGEPEQFSYKFANANPRSK